jgi:uncharacterized caspase-like protein
MSGLRFSIIALMLFGALSGARAQSEPARIALVLGNEVYVDGQVPRAASDAALVAGALQTAGFDVVGARDLGEEALRQALREFLDRAKDAGPDATAVLYFAGVGLQFEGDNYLVPVDARLLRPNDLPLQAVRASDVVGALSALPLRTRVVILDAARVSPLPGPQPPLPQGLVAMQPERGTLIAFNAAPGRVADNTAAENSAYALALAELLGQPGLPPQEFIDRVRARSAEHGGDVQAWAVSRLETPIVTEAPTAPLAAPPVVRQPRATAHAGHRHTRHVRRASPLAIVRARLHAFAHALSRSFRR